MNKNKTILGTVLAAAIAIGAQAQTYPPPFNQYIYATNLTTSNAFTAGKIVVLRAGEIDDTNFNIATVRQQPAFLEEYDPATTNQISPILSVALPTNDVNNSLFVNAHAGSEGQGFTRSADRQFLTFTGYTSPMNVPLGTPSSATNADGTGTFNRGFGLIDSYGNYAVIYSSQFWYGIQPGITQNNPRGVCTDGTNSYWGGGTIAGSQTGGFTETGTLFFNGSVSGQPELVQSVVNSSYFTKIVNNVLYMTAKNETGGASANGIYNFVDTPDNGGAPVPLPWRPGGVQHVVNTNLFLNFGSAFANVLAFDMNNAGTIVYAADNTAGIVKFTNNGAGTWSSPYTFGATNLGTAKQTKKAQGCFGITVDFSGPNPIIYATTMEQGDGNNTCSNRLIRIVDTGNPGTNMVADTLVQAGGINEVLRGVAFAPDLTPAITSEPSSVTVGTTESASFTVGVQSITNVTYQWQQNGSNVTSGGTSATLTLNSLTTNASGNSYVVIVTSPYGSVTSAPPAILTVLPPTAPTITNIAHITNFVGDTARITINPGGTPPFTYQWYFNNTMLVDDGIRYSGTTSSSLSISNVQPADSGNYYLAVTNSVSGISNLAAILSVVYLPPSIAVAGEPAPLIMLAGQTNSMTVSQVTGTAPLNYQWFQGSNSPTTQLSDVNEFTGTGTNTLTISGVSFTDVTNYFCVVSNNGGSTVSTAASVTVIPRPSLSYIAYSNQVYTQNFDTVPYQPGANINTTSGGGFQPINGVVYSPANPYDFAFPLFTNISGGNCGGLALSNSMPGWYGECDVVQAGAQIGAADGSTTTGGVYSFGATNNGNRALGLISTSSSLGVHFGLKLINTTGGNLNYISLKYLGEFWKNGTKPKTFILGYTMDPAGTNSTLTPTILSNAVNNSLPQFSIHFPTGTVGGINGYLAANQTNCAQNYIALSSPWPAGQALWLVWSITDSTGSGQGYGIDNFNFHASATNLPGAVTSPKLNGLTFSGASGSQFGFNNAPGAGAYMTVWGSTSASAPFSSWQNLGHPNETAFGTYQVTDALATNSPAKFYRITSP